MITVRYQVYGLNSKVRQYLGSLGKKALMGEQDLRPADAVRRSIERRTRLVLASWAQVGETIGNGEGSIDHYAGTLTKPSGTGYVEIGDIHVKIQLGGYPKWAS